jgi:hypothetical protein
MALRADSKVAEHEFFDVARSPTLWRVNRLKLNSPCTAGKTYSARDLNQLSVCLLAVFLVTTTVGEAYLVRTIGRRSESQGAAPRYTHTHTHAESGRRHLHGVE